MRRGWLLERDDRVAWSALAIATPVVAVVTLLAGSEVLRRAEELSAEPWTLGIGWLFVAAPAWALLAGGALAARRRATGLAVTLLAGAAVAAWGLAPSLSAGRGERGDGWLVGFLAPAAVTAILGLYASTPARRLGRWVPAVAAACVAFVLVALVLGLANLAGIMGTPEDVPGIVYYADLWVDLGVPVMLAAALGFFGSLRADARALVVRHAPPEPAWEAPRLAWRGRPLPVFWVLLAGSVGALFLSLRWPETSKFSGSYVELLLWPVVAAVARRWSRAWSWVFLGLACSGAAVSPLVTAVGRAGVEMTPTAVWGDPATIGASLRPMLVAIGLTSVTVAIGWTVLGLVRPRTWVPRTGVAAVMANAAVGLLALASGHVLLFLTAVYRLPFPPVDLLVPFLAAVPLAIAGGSAARSRLVEGFAEAERRPGLGLGGYIAVAAREVVTGEGRVRAVATEAERARLAADLHAEVLPGLARLRAESEAGVGPADLARRIAAMEEEVRGLLAERRLVVLEELGLVEALEWLADRAEDRSTMAIELTVDDRSSDDRPPRPVERAAFRVAQLAVDNAILHALAHRLAIEVLVRADEVRVRIEDDGRGLPGDGDALATERTAARANHAGLADMRAHARQVHARLDLVPAPHGGTIVSFGWAG